MMDLQNLIVHDFKDFMCTMLFLCQPPDSCLNLRRR